MAFALDTDVGGDGDDDDDDDVDADDNDRRPADEANSFNFCDSPPLADFTAIEWWAIIDCDSFCDDGNL